MEVQRSRTRRTGGSLPAGSSSQPKASIGRSRKAHSRVEQIVATYVYTDVDNFRALVQQLTGDPSTNPSSLPQTPDLKESEGRLQRHLRMNSIATSDLGRDRASLKRASTPKLFERRRNAKNLEVTKLATGPSIANLNSATIAKGFQICPNSHSPISILNAFEFFSDQSSNMTSPLGYTNRPSVPNTPTSNFNINKTILEPELEDGPSGEEPNQPRLLQLFPLHSSR
ncbi:hypothetical protein MPTK1_6g20390 [Marchantia polymorpha subsp. ruderalis]|nr:hypothetical protein MARPO_0045s0025 [Marchantia polymorpha]BBN15541.1 hypothetical protein Mp_6g20390 [Marchantia polymorpha subsp. ruderalis]|eukprot:PTQ39348.1 hypothetical protein MARPO_0045s0025 [Marchantia polymorpha]